MLEAAEALAQAGGLALVGAMATDAWQTARARAVELFRRRGPEQASALEDQLVRNAAQVERAGERQAERVREALAVAWQLELAELMADFPEAGEDVQRFADEVSAALPSVQKSWVMNVKAASGGQVFAVQDGTLNVHGTPTAPPSPPSSAPASSSENGESR
jgi:hypothetical protein